MPDTESALLSSMHGEKFGVDHNHIRIYARDRPEYLGVKIPHPYQDAMRQNERDFLEKGTC